MKVRWTDSSLRLRITPSELAALQRGESVEERLRIPGAIVGTGWNVVLLVGTVESNLDGSGGSILFEISKADLERFVQPDTEGLYYHRYGAADDLHGFSFYVEKDFPCIHPRPAEVKEPESETFEMPTGFAGRKV